MARRISYKEAYDNRSVPIAIANKQDRLTPGANVAISEDNVISVYGTEIGGYEAGEGIDIIENVISCTVDVTNKASKQELTDGLATKQDKLTAGQNITIENNVISATGGGGGSYSPGPGISISGSTISAIVANGLGFQQNHITPMLGDKMRIEDSKINTVESVRRILIGTDRTPSASLGEDGDIYIYRP